MIAKGPSQELVNVRQDGYLLCIAEKNVTKVKSTVVFWMRSEWSCL